MVYISLLQEMTGKSVILLPVGAGDDGAHSQNEKIDIRNYIEGVIRLLLNLYLACVALLQHHMCGISLLYHSAKIPLYFEPAYSFCCIGILELCKPLYRDFCYAFLL